MKIYSTQYKRVTVQPIKRPVLLSRQNWKQLNFRNYNCLDIYRYSSFIYKQKRGQNMYINSKKPLKRRGLCISTEKRPNLDLKCFCNFNSYIGMLKERCQSGYCQALQSLKIWRSSNFQCSKITDDILCKSNQFNILYDFFKTLKRKLFPKVHKH